jgi:hypothetical protein
MRTRALSSLVSAFTRLLASVCLRYGVAVPSLCPCSRGCKHGQFSNFRSDSPLNFTWFWFRFGDVGGALRVCRFVLLLAIASSVPAHALQCWTTARPSMCFSWRLRCLILRWKSGVNQVTVSCPLYSRVWDSGMPCVVVRMTLAMHRLSTTLQRRRLGLARC